MRYSIKHPTKQHIQKTEAIEGGSRTTIDYIDGTQFICDVYPDRVNMTSNNPNFKMIKVSEDEYELTFTPEP